MGDSRIPALSFTLTGQCQLLCKYCPMYSKCCRGENCGLDYEGFVSTGKVKELLKHAVSIGLKTIRISGGEPLLHPDFADILLFARRILGRAGRILLVTNGLLLHEHLDTIAAAAVDEVRISIDTIDPRLYAYITGRDILPSVIDNIKLLNDRAIYRRFNVVTLRSLLPGLLSFLAFAERCQADVKFIELNKYREQDPTFFAHEHIDPMILTQILNTNFEVRTLTPGGFGNPCAIIPYGNIYIQIRSTNRGAWYAPTHCSRCNYYPCADGLSWLTCTSDGRLALCKFGRHLDQYLWKSHFIPANLRLTNQLRNANRIFQQAKYIEASNSIQEVPKCPK